MTSLGTRPGGLRTRENKRRGGLGTRGGGTGKDDKGSEGD